MTTKPAEMQHTTIEALAQLIAREIFKCGNEPESQCNRLQFKGGQWPDNERNQGGIGEAPLAKLIEETIRKSHDQPDKLQQSLDEIKLRRMPDLDVMWLLDVVTDLRTKLENERAAVAQFLVPWRDHLGRNSNWLEFFEEKGIVYFDAIGFVYPMPLSGKPLQPHLPDAGPASAQPAPVLGAASAPAADPAATGGDTNAGATQ